MRRSLLLGFAAMCMACPPPLPAVSDEVCDDGADNDGDGRIDCIDDDCENVLAFCPNTERCNDDIDNDVDGLLDCLDPGCASDIACQPESDCGDGLDNNQDGDADCDDPSCAGDVRCQGEGACNDGIDGDLDGRIDCLDAECAADPSCPAFVLTASTEIVAGNALALRTNLPARVSDCVAVPASGVPCADLDGDGLSDAWEDVVLDRFRPIQRLDEDEQLVGDPSAVLGDVGRVRFLAPQQAGGPFRVHVMIMLGYSEDYGSCGGFTSHNGDSERVALNLEQDSFTNPGELRLVAAFTTGHEGTSNDQSRIFSGAALEELVYDEDPSTGEPRWVVFPSADKHATYATTEQCEDVSFIPCLDEDCGPDGVGNPALFDRLPPVLNAGEETGQLVNDLGAVGFPNEDPWAEQEFCGGRNRDDGCSSPVREKLLNDPFGSF